MYNKGQLVNLLLVGSEACKAAGYDKDFVDAAYEQIVSAIDSQEQDEDTDLTDGGATAVFAEDEIDEELRGIIGVEQYLDDVADKQEDVERAIEMIEQYLPDQERSRPFGTLEVARQLENLLIEYLNDEIVDDEVRDDLRAVVTALTENRKHFTSKLGSIGNDLVTSAENSADAIDKLASLVSSQPEQAPIVSEKPALSIADKCEVILLVLIDKLNWGSVVKIKMEEGNESTSSWRREIEGGDKTFTAIVPLHSDKEARDVASFEYMIETLYAEIATPFNRGIR